MDLDPWQWMKLQELILQERADREYRDAYERACREYLREQEQERKADNAFLRNAHIKPL